MQRAAQNLIVEWLDVFAPHAEHDSAEDRRRARLLVTAALFATTILFATAANSAWLGEDMALSFINAAMGATTLLIIVFAKRFSSLNLLAYAIVSLLFMHTASIATLSGGRNVGALFALSVYPIVAVVVAGWRAGLIFTGLSALTIITTPFVPIDWLASEALGPTPIQPTLVRDALNVTIAIGFVSALYDVARSSTIKDAREARTAAELSGAAARTASERQRKLIEISRRIHDMAFDGFDADIRETIKQTARLAGADRSVLRLIRRGEFAGRYSWGEDDGGSQEALNIGSGDLPTDRLEFRWSARFVAEGRAGQVRTLGELPPEADTERRYLESRGVVSWLCVPIWARGNAIGYQAFETLHAEKTWSDEECASLALITELLVSAVFRHRTEEALRESEIKFAGAFKHHPDAMTIMDLETNEIVECNDQWLVEMAVDDREDALGKTLWDFGFDLSPEYIEAMRHMLLESGRTPAVEIPVLGRTGDNRTYLVSATLIDVGGRSCALANVHDLTDRKQLEQQLLHSQKMEAVGRLAGGIAHDFNNMLTVISGYSSNLIQQLDGELRHDADEIYEAARRSADLTRQLLAFSRRQTLQTEVIDTNDMVRNLETMLRPLIGESIELSIELASEAALVRADRGQLEQAIVNLVVNARDAMPHGGNLTLETLYVEHEVPPAGPLQMSVLEPGRYVILAVTDNGAGMPPEVADRVMEPFYTTKPEGEGTGLGLAMVHGVARQCGGTLILDSEEGRGTRAEIHLPAAEQEAERQVSATAAPSPAANASSLCVLLVEDEPTLRRLAARSLKSGGYEVVEAENGVDALDRAEDLGDGIDVVVSDIVMPKLSGTEFVHQLRQQRPELPVVLMSGYPDAGGEGAAVPDDVIFLQKPFEPSLLLDSIRAALESKAEA